MAGGGFRPDVGDVHVNVPLTNLSVGYQNADYVADTLFPIVYVDKQSNSYITYDKSHWFRDEAQLRAPGTWAEESGWTTGSGTYFAQNYALAKSIPDELRANADSWARLDQDATYFVTDKLQMRREVAWATSYFKTGVWSTDRTGVASSPSASQFIKFSDYGASSPITVFRTYGRTMREKILRRPNTLVIGEFFFDVIADHPDFIERIKGAASPGSPAVVNERLLAQVLGLERVVIASAMYTTTAEGVAEASVTYSNIFDDDALLLYVPASPSLMTPAAGYTFIWSSAMTGNAPQFIRRLRDDRGRKDIIEGHTYYDQKLTAADAGLFLNDAVD